MSKNNMHITVTVNLDGDNVTKISDKVFLVDIGTAEGVLLMIANALGNPGKFVMMRKEGRE